MIKVEIKPVIRYAKEAQNSKLTPTETKIRFLGILIYKKVENYPNLISENTLTDERVKELAQETMNDALMYTVRNLEISTDSKVKEAESTQPVVNLHVGHLIGPTHIVCDLSDFDNPTDAHRHTTKISQKIQEVILKELPNFQKAVLDAFQQCVNKS